MKAWHLIDVYYQGKMQTCAIVVDEYDRVSDTCIIFGFLKGETLNFVEQWVSALGGSIVQLEN